MAPNGARIAKMRKRLLAAHLNIFRMLNAPMIRKSVWKKALPAIRLGFFLMAEN